MKIVDKKRGTIENIDLVSKAMEILGVDEKVVSKKAVSATLEEADKASSQAPVGGQGTGMTKGPAKTPANATTPGGGGL